MEPGGRNRWQPVANRRASCQAASALLDRQHRVIVKDVLPALDEISNELNDKPHLSLAQ